MSAVEEYESKGNVHLDVSASPQELPFHRRVGELAAAYAPRGGTVIDIGCGLGESSAVARNAAPDLRITLADAYQVCLDKASAHVNAEATVLMSEQGFSISELVDRRYDVAILSHVMEHMLDPVGAVTDVLEIVEPGGHLVLAVPNPVRPDVILNALRRHHYVNRGHVMAWDRSHLMNFLERILGLDVVEYASDEVKIIPRRLAGGRWLDRFQTRLATLLPWWSFTSIAVIRKHAA